MHSDENPTRGIIADTAPANELMTPREAAAWFRRSCSWLRQQRDLLRITANGGGQPLYHVRVCRAYVLGKLARVSAEELRTLQLEALASACGLARLSGAAPLTGAIAPSAANPED